MQFAEEKHLDFASLGFDFPSLRFGFFFHRALRTLPPRGQGGSASLGPDDWPMRGSEKCPLRSGQCSANVLVNIEPSGGPDMVARVSTVAFEGVEARPVDVQVHIAGGAVAFTIVGLGDKAVAESRERVRSALVASGLALPAKRITVNLAPADMPKEGSHYDLPIALAVMAAIGAIPPDALDGFAVIGELALDGAISAVAGVLPAAIAANAAGKGLICPAPCGPEAAWASADLEILAPAFADPARQPLQGLAGVVPSRAGASLVGWTAGGPARHPGPGERQARARDRGGRRPQPPDVRRARRGKIDARPAPSVDSAAAHAARTPRSVDDPFGRRRSSPAAR